MQNENNIVFYGLPVNELFYSFGINHYTYGRLNLSNELINLFWNGNQQYLDNIVDFTKLNGIIGMFAPNASGKSALLDSLSFCLFDTSARAFKADRVLNNKKNSFSCKINF